MKNDNLFRKRKRVDLYHYVCFNTTLFIIWNFTCTFECVLAISNNSLFLTEQYIFAVIFILPLTFYAGHYLTIYNTYSNLSFSFIDYNQFFRTQYTDSMHNMKIKFTTRFLQKRLYDIYQCNLFSGHISCC